MHPFQRQKMSFLVRDSGPSELNFNILKRGMDYSNVIDTVMFFEHITKPCISSLVSKMQFHEAYLFDGAVIATDINTASKLIKFPSPRPKLFFLNDLEWIRFPNKQYEMFASVYRNPELTLLCRSEEHKKLIEGCWNVKVFQVVEKYDFYNKELLDFIITNSKPLYDNRSKPTVLLNNKTLGI